MKPVALVKTRPQACEAGHFFRENGSLDLITKEFELNF